MARIPALLEERRGYVRRGLMDRVALVDAELAAEGYTETADAAPVVETADAPKRRGRPSKPESADA